MNMLYDLEYFKGCKPYLLLLAREKTQGFLPLSELGAVWEMTSIFACRDLVFYFAALQPEDNGEAKRFGKQVCFLARFLNYKLLRSLH